jgi:hypothetical protein
VNKRGNSEEWTLAAACLYINAYSIGEDGRREGLGVEIQVEVVVMAREE